MEVHPCSSLELYNLLQKKEKLPVRPRCWLTAKHTPRSRNYIENRES